MAATYELQFINTNGESLITTVTYHNYRKAFPTNDNKTYPLNVVEFRDVAGAVQRVNLADVVFASATPMDSTDTEDDV